MILCGGACSSMSCFLCDKWSYANGVQWYEEGIVVPDNISTIDIHAKLLHFTNPSNFNNAVEPVLVATFIEKKGHLSKKANFTFH